ncbi:uncharacterized protein LOC120187113 [Hibiscus syriacus]|uniref:uncharacterized protein LOC120187113 n=1 Tax=Hibiscus syriacus TaxID=106335 RepID=UPI0019240AD6|nr:uncharacterized protein LOC120187113 [Hibiscus syriacus]
MARVTMKIKVSSPLASPIVKWKPPPLSWVKENFYASFLHGNQLAWSGVIIRDVDGLILGACRRKVDIITSSFVAETVAALHAVRLSLDLGFTQVIVEGDCRSVIQSLASSMADRSKIGIWVHEGRKLATPIRACRFQHVPRIGNKAAHLLASFNSTST